MRKLFLGLFTSLLIACATQPHTYDETVWYTYATTAVVVNAAVAIVNDPATPPEVSAPITLALLQAEPYIVKLHDADVAVDMARDEIAKGTGTQEKLQAALALLQAAETAIAAPLNTISAATAKGVAK